MGLLICGVFNAFQVKAFWTDHIYVSLVYAHSVVDINLYFHFTFYTFHFDYLYLTDPLNLPVLGVSSSSSFNTMRPTAKERRVRFQQETKSQSLDTPYHHTHEQHKLDMDMDSDTMAERSNSFTAISQCYTSEKGKDKYDIFVMSILPF